MIQDHFYGTSGAFPSFFFLHFLPHFKTRSSVTMQNHQRSKTKIDLAAMTLASSLVLPSVKNGWTLVPRVSRDSQDASVVPDLIPSWQAGRRLED
jgi:hypothetical protein